jgi:hypothetical protein
MHVELQEKKRRLTALKRQDRLRVIRQKADKAREQLRRMDEYLVAVEANTGAQPEDVAAPQPERQW